MTRTTKTGVDDLTIKATSFFHYILSPLNKIVLGFPKDIMESEPYLPRDAALWKTAHVNKIYIGWIVFIYINTIQPI